MLPSASAIDWAGVRRRLRYIGAALELEATEIEEVISELAKGNEAKLFAFVKTHGQNLEWVITGDLTPMLRLLAGKASRRHSLPLAPSLATDDPPER